MASRGDARGGGPERAYHATLPETGSVRLDREEAHHLVRVRRVRAGEEVVLFDGRGGSKRGRLLDADAGGATVEVLAPYPDREPRRAVTVACALPASGRADDLVVALAELGVSRLVPLACRRGAADAADAAKRRHERFERLVREAAKVNGRSRFLSIEDVRAPRDAVGVPGRRPFADLCVLLDTDPALPRLPAALGDATAPCLLLVGPEGGFTDEEAAEVRGAGARLASLGTCVLRTETAAVAAASVALAM
jgi:16S rRNA (uracil1498-N3)-methyltransferase